MHKNIWINWSIEFGPIALFFLTLKIAGDTNSGFIFATGLFTAATVAALIAAFVRDRRIALFPIISGLTVIVFGIITVYFKSPTIFIVKDTIYNGIFALLLLIGVIFKKGLLKPLFGSLFDISDRGWLILSFRWMIMFVLLAVSNEYVRIAYSQDVWVMYKFFATIVTTIFGSYQIFLSKKHRNETASEWGMRITNHIKSQDL